MSKKVSAFQVYSDEQTHQRHSRSYRPATSGRSHLSPPPARSGRTTSMDWRDEVKGSDSRAPARAPARHSSSPEVRRDQSYSYDNYDSRREEHGAGKDSRYREDVRHIDKDRQTAGTRYRTDSQYDRCSWDGDDRRDSYATSRDRGSHVHKDDYLDAQRQLPAKSAQPVYTDSDEECLHENLRRKKPVVERFSVEPNDRQWSSDDYSDFRPSRKRALSGTAYRSPSPEQAKDWRDSRRFSPQQDHARTYSPPRDDSDREYLDSPPAKKKKVKGAKKNAKAKEKKHKALVEQNSSAPVVPSGKIQSLMDVKIPSSVKKQVEQSTTPVTSVSVAVTSLAKFGEGRPEYKFVPQAEDTGRSIGRNHDDDRTSSRYDDSSRNRSRYSSDYYQDHRREPAFGRRESESDRRRHHSQKDSYNSRHSPDYDHRTYHQSDDFDRGRDRQRRTSFNRDGRSNTETTSTKRKRQSSAERREWSRSGGRMSQRDRSPDFSNYSDSDQDSDRGGRRSWRDERRDRQPKKKDEDRDKGQKGEKKSKSKQEPASNSKSSQRTKKSSSSGKKETASQKEPEPSTRMQVLPCKEGVAVFLTHPQSLCMRGRASLRVVAGEVKVMGYPMEVKGSKSYNLFSPSTSSLITITSVSAEKEKKPLRKAVQSLGVDEKAVKDFLTSGAVILLASRLDFHTADYICTHPPFTQLFRYNFDRAPNPPSQTPASGGAAEVGKVGAAFLCTEQAAAVYLKESDEFDGALSKWTSALKSSKTSPVGLLCGAVNSGKSTFSRYMVNAALACVPKVCYLDCDVGQTEFSPPGTISLTVLDRPIFGPPFCHQKIAERMCFYGMVNPAEGPSYYVQCVEYVLKAYRELEDPPPLVVNTMGWNKDVGLHLFLDVVHLVTPDLLVQFNVATDVLNFPPMTPHFVAHEPGWIYNTELVEEEEEGEGEKKKEQESEPSSKKTHEHVTVQSLVSSRNDPTRVKLTPKNLRDLALLGHLMQGLMPPVTLTSAKPYTVPWSGLALHLHHGDTLTVSRVDALRAAIVALCKADLSQAYRESEDSPLLFKEPPVCECFGYGLVREVNHETRTLKVVTSVSLDRLSQVNTLLKGSVSTPDQLPLKQGHMEDVPFIDALEPAMALAPVRPRTRMPRRGRL